VRFYQKQACFLGGYLISGGQAHNMCQQLEYATRLQ
jgi:hypothetical protein